MHFHPHTRTHPHACLVGFPVPVEALEAREHEHVVVGLLVQLGAPVPRRCEAPVDARPAVVPYTMGKTTTMDIVKAQKSREEKQTHENFKKHIQIHD